MVRNDPEDAARAGARAAGADRKLRDRDEPGAARVHSVRCGWETIADILADPGTRDLILAYNEELNPHPEIAQIAPDWDAMRAREEQGILKTWVCRVDGSLAGYIQWHVMASLMFRSTLYGIDTGHYLAPAFRDKGRIGYRMWYSAEQALKELGVRVIMAHDNEIRPLMPFFLALGYEPRSTIFYKVL